MAYAGKFVDKTPVICAAGKTNAIRETVADNLTSYTLQDAIDALKHEANIYKEISSDYPSAPSQYKLPPLSSSGHRGIYTDIRQILTNPVKTRFQTIIDNLKDSTYDSYWNKPLGKSKDATAGLPAGMIPETVTFGKPYPNEPSVKELINPSVDFGTIFDNAQIGHDMYVKTHNDYNPSERVKRGYLQPAFNPNKTFGIKTNYDLRGIWFPCCTTWYDPEMEAIGTKQQARLHEKTKGKIGKARTPNHNEDKLPKGYRFGIKSNRSMCNVEELLRDSDIQPCWFKKDSANWLKHMNSIRMQLKKRQDLDFSDFLDRLRNYDKNPKTHGWISLNNFYQISDCYRIYFNKTLLEPYLESLGFLKDHMVQYTKVVELLNWQYMLPHLPFIKDIPPERLINNYKTQNQAAEEDWKIINNNCMPAAGISNKTMKKEPYIAPGSISAYKEDLGAETTVESLLNPSILTQYGITHRDFFQPREKHIIRHLFHKIGYDLNDDLFDKLWKIGQRRDQSDLVCLDTIYNLLIQFSIPLIKNKPNKLN